MAEDLVNIKYSHDGEYRYKIESREDGLFQVWVEQKMYDYYNNGAFSDMEFVGWGAAIDDNQIHLADNYERAYEIGSELLCNLTGTL